MGFFYTQGGPIRPASQGYVRPSETLLAQGCRACPLNRVRLQHPKMEPQGAASPILYIIKGTPGKGEDQEGELFFGKDGELIRKAISRNHHDKIRYACTTRCYPGEYREASRIEQDCCRRQQVQDIEKARPRAVLLIGSTAIQWATQHSGATAPIWHSIRIPIRFGSHVCWAYPTLDPYAYLKSDSPNNEDMLSIFRKDVQRAMDRALAKEDDEPVVEDPKQYYANTDILQTPTINQLIDRIDRILSDRKEIGWDYETSTLRPYAKRSRILTVAMSSYDNTLAFPYQHPGFDWGRDLPQVREIIRETLRSCKPIAHNAKFEMEWTAHEFGEAFVWDVDWQCTMAQHYVLDSRKGARSLGDLTVRYMGFNVKGLSSIDTGRLEQTRLDQVLKYNALDAKYVVPLYDMQQYEVAQESLTRVCDEQIPTARTLAITQRRGVMPNTEKAVPLQIEYAKKLADIDQRIMDDPAVREAIKQGRPFEPTKNEQIGYVFHSILGFKEVVTGTKRTGEPTYGVDETVLSEIDHPLAGLILERRGVAKLKSTYIDIVCPGGSALSEDGLIHASFDHNHTTTRRLASEGPNMQNFPKRKNKEVRIIIRAPEGHWMVCIDYGQIEARVIGVASQDVFLIKALWEDYDIHTEWAERIAHCDKRWWDRVAANIGIDPKDTKKVKKALRQDSKNMWVFPLFFGSSLNSVSQSLQIDKNKLSPVYDEFWRTFSGVKEWQEGLIEFYEKMGYVQTLGGFRRRAPVSYNEIINTPIQGSAAEIVLDAGNRLAKTAYRKSLDMYQIRLNVHDDLTFYFPDNRLEEAIDYAAREMCCVPFDYINVPIIVEVTGGLNWYEQEEIAVYKSTDYGFPARRPAAR